MSDWIAADYPYKVVQVKGVAGNATGLLEYVCEAEPGVATSAGTWRIRKLVYDSTGFNTQILWADGDRNFDNVQESYAGYSYS